MKIIVQGTTINTENIYSISEIKQKHTRQRGLVFQFVIKSINNKKLKVYIVPIDQNHKLIDDGTDINFYRLIPIANKERLEKVRQNVIKVWSENQSKMPNFDID